MTYPIQSKTFNDIAVTAKNATISVSTGEVEAGNHVLCHASVLEHLGHEPCGHFSIVVCDWQ